MLQKFIQLVRANAVRAPALPQDLGYRPYASGAVNQLYNSLFCRDPGLRLTGQGVAPPQLHGVIVETHLATGLDVLAVFADGTVRYIEPSGEPVACDLSLP